MRSGRGSAMTIPIAGTGSTGTTAGTSSVNGSVQGTRDREAKIASIAIPIPIPAIAPVTGDYSRSGD